MDSRHGRGRGGHWKRGGGGGGGGDSGSSGEQRGRGRGGHHRGRGKRDHHRGRGRYHGPAADFRQNQDDHDEKEKTEEEEDNTTHSRRKLESNWARYEEFEREEANEDVPTQRGADYHVLLSSAGDSYSQFRFSDEKDWEMDFLAQNQIPALFLDLPALTQSLEKLPLHTRLNLEADLVELETPVELPSMAVPHRRDSTPAAGLKAPQTGRDSGLAASHPVKPVPATAPSLSVSTAAQSPTDEEDQELDFLLSLQKPLTEVALDESSSIVEEAPNNPMTASAEKEEEQQQTVEAKDTTPDVEREPKSTRQELTEEDLEDWLDSMIS